jgi:hypothetical protein
MTDAKHTEATAEQVIDFLNGTGALDGAWFGDAAFPRKRYWWRKYLHLLRHTAARSEPSEYEALEKLAVAMADQNILDDGLQAAEASDEQARTLYEVSRRPHWPAWEMLHDDFHKPWRETASEILQAASLPVAVPEIESLRKENDTLRRILANSNDICVYCGLTKASMAECVHGFPGCHRADDMQPIAAPRDTGETDNG